MSSHCWVIKRSITGVIYTVRNTVRNGSDMSPCLLAFISKNRALQFKKFVNDTEDKNKPHQKLVLEKLPKSTLIKRCSVTSLDVHIFEENITYIACSEPTDDVRLHMENNFGYF